MSKLASDVGLRLVPAACCVECAFISGESWSLTSSVHKSSDQGAHHVRDI